jgi:hypothetical protein
MNDDLLGIWDGSGRGLIEILSRHLSRSTAEYHKKPRSG